MANLRYVLNGVTLLPALPVERTTTINRTRVQMLVGNTRDYLRPADDTTRWTLTLPDADEIEHGIWRGAMLAARATPVTLSAPEGVFTVVCVGWSDPLTRTAPTSGSGTDGALGAMFRDITLELESR